MLRADNVRFRSVTDSVASWEGGWQKVMADLAQMRMRYIQMAAWPSSPDATNVMDVGARAPRVGDVFKSAATMALLLRWHIKAPGEILTGGARGQGRLTQIFTYAVRNSPTDVLWHPTGTGGGLYDSTLWGPGNEKALAHAIRHIARDDGPAQSHDGGLRRALLQMWPAEESESPTEPGQIPSSLLWTDRTFPEVGAALADALAFRDAPGD
jgi:hypothetical protein